MKKYFIFLFACSQFVYGNSQDDLQQPIQNAATVDLVCVYTKIFHDATQKTESFLEVVAQAKDYWQQELFVESLPWTRKSPTYWFHRNSYVKLLRKRIALLTDVENQVSTLLGIALHGQHELSKIDGSVQTSQEFLTKCATPLYHHFHVSCGDFNIIEQQQLFQESQYFMDIINIEMEKFEKLITAHKKPHHLVRHQVTYACAATVAVAALVAYQAYKDQIPGWQTKGKEAFDNFSQTCLMGPVKGLKEILVDNKNTKIQELGPILEFKKCENNITHNGLSHWLGIAKDMDTVPESLNNGAESVRVFINQFIPVAESILTSQQINFYLAAIAPAFIATYGVYRGGDALYDRYVRHDWRYKPMKNMVRAIDRLLNNIAPGQQKSFCDDGKLHVLTLKLKSYMYCLCSQELVLFQEDIAALLSFDLSYAQKHGVVSSMYKTYEFLK
ncbi:MAG: hypothetical protein NTZ68_00825 [Candidatus Dependentiae bacterium]|nr:hypothetical protein [Candidatus Dependentiae bacterium]